MALNISKTLADRKARAALLADGIKEVARSKENTGGIVKIINALGGTTMQDAAKRFEQTEQGASAVADPDRLLRILQDRDYLAACPEGSLGRAYYDFVYRENLSADGLVEAVNEGAQMRLAEGEVDPAAIAMSARFRDLHDLWHVTTGYGRDVLGEMSILFFSFAQIQHPGFAFISLVAAGVAKIVDRDVPSYRILMEAYMNGRTANWLMAEPWEEMFETPVEEVRGRFGISRPKLYERSADKAARLERRIQKLQGRIAGALAA